VLEAIQAGNDRGLHQLEYQAASARAKGQPVGIRGWTVASFRHLTSRALDPFPHHHNVVANTVVDEHGTRRALDARTLYWNAREASALATAEMRHQLTQTLGVRWRPGRTGGWEIAGIDNEVVREFSRRRNEIDDAIAELESAIGRHSNLDEVQRIITNTRPDKTDVDPSQLVEGWWTRARSHGLTPRRLSSAINSDAVEQHVDIKFIFGRLADPIDGVCANISTFTRADVIAALVDLPVPNQDGPDQPLLLRADDIERLADQFLASEAVIPLEPTNLPAESALSRSSLFSTTEILSVQHRILTAYDAGLHAEAAFVSPEMMREAIKATTLTDEQAELVSSLCQSGHRVQCAIGRAGTGKTTSMRAAARAWEQSGWTVVGAAVKGEAARHRADGAEIPTETVAWYLARRDRPSLPLDDRTVLVIDEASTLSDRDLDALLRVAADRGSVVRLIGDPAQHGAVAAGGMFGHLCGRNPDETPELTTTHRLVDPAERNAVEALRLGDIDRAMDQLEAAGKLHLADDEIGLYIGMLQRWWGAHQVG
ncbi:MAG: MobF family relaxase, partial [Actinomycetota bacterium]